MKNPLIPRLILILVLLGVGFRGYSQPQVPDSTKVKAGPLFKSDKVLHVKLIADFRAIQKDRGDEGSYHEALLRYVDKHGDSIALPLKVKVRGNFRRDANNCSLPPLLLNFPEKKVKNTVFKKQDRLKLVTRCQAEGYVAQEYMVYKIYNLLTDYSFKARMAVITYEDSSGNRKTETSAGFIIEDEDILAKRLKSKLRSGREKTEMYLTDQVGMATVAVFQYMIGNTDWSVPVQHNIKLLEQSRGLPMPVAYDFDHAGIVEAKYATPAEMLNLRSTRQRLYRGYSYTPEIFENVFKNFNRIKPQVYALYRESSNLNERYVDRTLKYLDEFYETINDSKRAGAVFMSDSKKGNDEIKGLK